MKNYIKYISLGAATLLLGSFCEAGIREDLDAANVAFKALTNTPENWKTVAKEFIRIYDTFNGELIAIAEAHGARKSNGIDTSYIDAVAWKDKKVVRSGWHCYHLPDSLQKIYGDPCILTYKDYKKYFDKNIGKFLKKAICSHLGIPKKKRLFGSKYNLKGAGVYWEENFINPVGTLIIDHSAKMEEDAETLQLLLDLYRCYRLSEQMPTTYSGWSNLDNARNGFYDGLANAVLGCENLDAKRNILYAILTINTKINIKGKQYFGSSRYALEPMFLSDLIKTKMGIEGIKELPEAIRDAVAKLNEKADAIRCKLEAYAQGQAAQRGITGN